MTALGIKGREDEDPERLEESQCGDTYIIRLISWWNRTVHALLNCVVVLASSTEYGLSIFKVIGSQLILLVEHFVSPIYTIIPYDHICGFITTFGGLV